MPHLGVGGAFEQTAVELEVSSELLDTSMNSDNTRQRLRILFIEDATMIMQRMSTALLALLVFACAPFQQDPVYDGVWRQQGYGRIVSIRDGDPTVYQTTTVSCVPESEEDFHYFRPGEIGPWTLSSDRNSLTVNTVDGNIYRFSREEVLPSTCLDYEASDDPVLNFEIFWRTFEENYPFFELHNVDWQATYETFQPQVDAETTDEQLFEILKTMVDPFHDAHVGIRAGELRYRSAGYEFADKDEDIWTLVRRRYLKGNYTTHLEWLQHGRLDERTGYIRVRSMGRFSLYDEEGPAQEVALVDRAMEEILEDLSDVDKIILDLRFNGGGYDQLARAIADRFADERRFAYSKRPRIGARGEYAEPVNFYVEPRGNRQFTDKVVVLQNGATVSAAEIFLMCMEPLPHVTFVGEASRGSYSDVMGKNLPNGWSFWFGNELYTNYEGINYERTGQPPDIEVRLTLEDLEENERDAALERAMELW